MIRHKMPEAGIHLSRLTQYDVEVRTMKEQKTDRYARVSHQVDRVRKLYSQIGEPLPADVIIELYQHLDRALELAERPQPKPANKRKLDA